MKENNDRQRKINELTQAWNRELMKMFPESVKLARIMDNNLARFLKEQSLQRIRRYEEEE